MATIRINITGAVDPEYYATLEKTTEAAKGAQGKIARDHVAQEKKKTDATQKEAEKRARIERQTAREQKRHIDSLHREQADKDRERTSRARSQDALDESRRNNERRARNNRRTEDRAIERDEQHIAKQADVRRAKIAADDKRAQAEFKRWHNNKQKIIADGASAEQAAARRTDLMAARRHTKIAGQFGRGAMMGGAAAIAVGSGLAMVGSQIVGAAGVHTDLGSVFGGAFELGNRATDLSNQAYIPGDRRNDRVVDPTTLRRESLDVAGKTGFGGNDVMSGLQAFVAKTGDLSTARDIIQDIAKLSKATGSSLEDMASASADVSTQLGDVPNKAEAVADVMKTIAAQGKMGAVEIADLASKMASLAASAGKFEGSRSENIKKFGALIQLARAHGGATSAAESATSLQALSTQFQKGARQKGFDALGVNTKGADGRFRDLPDVLMDVLFKTRGDLRKSQQAIGDQRAQKPYLGMQDIFLTEHAARMKNASFGVGMGAKEREELAATESIARVREEFDKLYKAEINNAEVERAFKAAMGTAASKANQVNVEFEKVATELSGNFMVALVELSPVIKGVGDVLMRLFLGADGAAAAKRGLVDGRIKGAKDEIETLINNTPEFNMGYGAGQYPPMLARPTDPDELDARKKSLAKAGKKLSAADHELALLHENVKHNPIAPKTTMGKLGALGAVGLTSGPTGVMSALMATKMHDEEANKQLGALISLTKEAADAQRRIARALSDSQRDPGGAPASPADGTTGPAH